jgi:hypothetical protein
VKTVTTCDEDAEDESGRVLAPFSESAPGDCCRRRGKNILEEKGGEFGRILEEELAVTNHQAWPRRPSDTPEPERRHTYKLSS